MTLTETATFNEQAYAEALLARIVRECPRRRACSEDERRTHELMQGELDQLGLPHGALEGFTFTDSIYANMALHFGLGSLGTAVSGLFPAAGFALHALAGTSYLLDSTKRAFLLRRLLPAKRSQNLVVTLPAPSGGPPSLRLVFLAHADAAFTGLMFEERVVRQMNPAKLPKQLRFLSRGLALSTYSQFTLAGLDLLRLCFGPLTWPLRPVEALLSLPALVTTLLNLQVVLKNEIVPGANDNLSGVVALALLGRRLLQERPDGLELVFVVTGAEEAGLGGATHLARRHADAKRWARRDTVVIGLDSLGNGELVYFDEGEVITRHVPRWLREVLAEVARADPRFADVRSFRIPVGGTDALPFIERGYDAVSIGCVDRELGAPRHYHLPSDTPENLDVGTIVKAVEFTERLVRKICVRRGVT